MEKLKNFVSSLHQSTKRDYLERMINNKVECMQTAKEFGFEYWDGERQFGYGGYKYIPNRWKLTAQSLIDCYKLNENSKILDVGCGKGFLLHEIKSLIPEITVEGIDISEHGIGDSTTLIKPFLKNYDARLKLAYNNNHFDLVISLGMLHNFKINELMLSLTEIERVGNSSYIMVESFRNNQELFNLQCWALTAESFYDSNTWIWLLNHFGYTGDYEFIYFE